MPFLAIDFETADYGRDSACALGLALVHDGRIVEKATHLIKPPRRDFIFSYIHGITWEDVRRKPTFAQLWPDIEPMFAGADFVVAHNASFDRGVLRACCLSAGVEPPSVPFKCTMVLARRLWGIHPTTLAHVCRRFEIPLNHHDAGSDTEACARIMIKVLQELGYDE